MLINIVWAMGVVVLFQLFLPYSIGKALKLKDYSAIAWGNVLQLAVFFALCQIMFLLKKTPQEICNIWYVVSLIVMVLLIVFIIIKREWKIPSLKEVICFVVPILILSFGIVAVHMITFPSVADVTLEKLVIQIKCNAIDYMNPYTKELLTGIQTTRMSPLLVYYQMICSLVKLSPFMMITYAVSCGIIWHVYCAYRALAQTLFREKSSQVVFVMVAALVYVSFLFKGDGFDMFKLLTTSWNGEVYWLAFILPLLFELTVRAVDSVDRQAGVLRIIVSYVLLMLAGQLLMPYGFAIVVLAFFIVVVMFFIRRITGVNRKH